MNRFLTLTSAIFLVVFGVFVFVHAAVEYRRNPSTRPYEIPRMIHGHR